MTTIRIGDAERHQGKLSAQQVAKAKQALLDDGFVVLESAIPIGIIETLRERAFADIDALAKRTDGPYNWNRGNLQQDPAPFPPYLFREVLANEFAIQVTESILGAGMYNGFYSGNTAMPSEERQPVHADIGQLWPEQEIAHPPYGIIVNVPLVDVSPANGSTEIWPGTHRDTSVTMQSGTIEASEAALAHWRSIVPPVQPDIPAGSILLRDVRLWHAGMPNRTQMPRPMIAMIHYVNWWPCDRFKLDASAETLLAHPRLRQHAEFTSKPIDHISAPGGHAYEAPTEASTP